MNKSVEFFEKFLELGSVAKVAAYYGTTRQNVHQYLVTLPQYQRYRRTPPPPAPSCPRCDRSRTINKGSRQARKQYLCKNCGFHWEKTVYSDIGKPN